MLHPNRMKFMIGHILGLTVTTSMLISCGSGGSANSSTSPGTPPVAGTTVQVSVTATDPDGDQLHYRWASTDGTINNVDAPKTTWVVPSSSGLQFAYVVVSDNKGGYIESRAAALAFDQQTSVTTTPQAIPQATFLDQAGFVWGSVYSDSPSFRRRVYLPGVTITLDNDENKRAVTDMKGQFFIPNVPNGSHSVTYKISGQPEASFSTTADIDTASNNLPTSPSSGAYFEGAVTLTGTLSVAGSVRMTDFSYCGIRDEFFSHSSAPNLFRGPVSGSAQLLDETNKPLSNPFPINHYGDFLIVRGAGDPTPNAKVRVTCEGAVADSDPFDLPSSGTLKLPKKVTLPNSRPTITTMSVQLNGQEIGRPDLPKPRTLFTSVDGSPPRFGTTNEGKDLIAEIIHTPGDDAFFTYKGIDTRKSACAYYRAIRAVEGCDADGFPTGAQLTLEQWRSQFNLSPFLNGNPSNPIASDGQEVRLQYINRSDLNLGRDMQAVKLTDGTIAYNTCNYPGPQDVKSALGAPKEIGEETQADIDLSIDNMQRGIGLIVCVAMDNSAIEGVNGGKRFTKFYTFGPRGNLLLSVSLDGRREKFMPGTCTTCHGGDAYGGQFPYEDNKVGQPNLASRWQPFDMANLKVRFSSTQDPAAANAAVKKLNKRLIERPLTDDDVDARTTPRTRQLIEKWYAGDRLDQDPSVIPDGSGSKDADVYRKVIQPGCQTCHAAQKVNENLTDTKKVCGGDRDLEQNHKMTNSLVPFERFWLDFTNPGSTLPQLLKTKHGLDCGENLPKRHPAL